MRVRRSRSERLLEEVFHLESKRTLPSRVLNAKGSGGKKGALTRDDILEVKPAFNTTHATTHPEQLHDYISSYFLRLVAP